MVIFVAVVENSIMMVIFLDVVVVVVVINLVIVIIVIVGITVSKEGISPRSISLRFLRSALLIVF